MPVPILMNSKAGALHEQSGPDEFRRMADSVGVELDIHLTHSKDEYVERLRHFVQSKEPRLAIAGGDGTVDIAIQELAHSETALGIISQGTFNNFASSLRLPHNLPAALEILRTGQIVSVDLGKVNDRYFAESCGVGLFADGLALYGAGSNKNFLRGAYAFSRIALSYRPRVLELEIDGKQISEPVVLCEVANTYRVAQAVPIAPCADVDDGLLDIVLFTDVRRNEILHYLKALRAQIHLGLPHVKHYQGKRITIKSAQKRSVHADDSLCGFTPVQIDVQPKALRVLTDPRL